ncbi:MAG: hypothetical protein ACI808_002074 [Paraglaciecola sp.]|jgi:hypothetical protein
MPELLLVPISIEICASKEGHQTSLTSPQMVAIILH